VVIWTEKKKEKKPMAFYLKEKERREERVRDSLGETGSFDGEGKKVVPNLKSSSQRKNTRRKLQ